MRDASETSLIEQPGLKRVANLQALPELFNCHIFRSKGNILNVLPQSPSALLSASPGFILRVVNNPSNFLESRGAIGTLLAGALGNDAVHTRAQSTG